MVGGREARHLDCRLEAVVVDLRELVRRVEVDTPLAVVRLGDADRRLGLRRVVDVHASVPGRAANLRAALALNGNGRAGFRGLCHGAATKQVGDHHGDGCQQTEEDNPPRLVAGIVAENGHAVLLHRSRRGVD